MKLGPLLAALATAAIGVLGVRQAPVAAHDADVVRAVGVGFTGVFRALDAVVAAPIVLAPLGTRALRAGLASALVAAVCAAIATHVARDLTTLVVPEVVRRQGKAVSPALLGAVSVVAVLVATLGPVWQGDLSAPGSAALGATLVFASLALSARATPTMLPLLAFVLGLAASYEPLAFAAALGACTPFMPGYRGSDRAILLRGAMAFLLGLVPLALGFALARRDPAIALAVPYVSILGPRATTTPPIAFVKEEIGVLLLGAALLGSALAAKVPGARRMAIALGLVCLIGALSVIWGVSGTALLAGVLALHVLAGLALAAIVVAIARAPLPFAQASAALVVVLELVLPVRSADESLTRRDARAPRATSWWCDVAWGAAPPAAVVLVPTPAILARVAAASAVGDTRGDLVFVPAFDLRTRLGDRGLAAEPKLAPLYRDVALGLPPEELSFAQLAEQRAVLASFDPKWDRALARHLIPVGLLTRFETEPRGISDRKKAFDAFAPEKEHLVRVAVARKDPELAALTAYLLRARAIAMAATGDREVLSRALDDLRGFAPDDPVASALVRRFVTTKGAIDVHDLVP